MQHLLVTSRFLPALGGRARRFTEIARRFPEPMSVSTVADPNAARYDAAEDYPIERQSFSAADAAKVFNRIRWARALVARTRERVNVLHAAGVSDPAPPVWWVHKRERVPYALHVSAGEVALELDRVTRSRISRRLAQLVFGDAAAIIASSTGAEHAVGELVHKLGIGAPPPVRVIHAGADTTRFHPRAASARLRAEWGIGRAPVLLTVAPLDRRRGQETGIRALAALREDFPSLRYILVGEGDDEIRLRNLAAELHVMDRVGFAGPMRDDELPSAYATSSVYLDTTPPTSAEGDGASVLEAAACGLAVVVPPRAVPDTIVVDGGTGVVADTADVWSVSRAIAGLLRDRELRERLGGGARDAVASGHDWSDVAIATARFVTECVSSG